MNRIIGVTTSSKVVDFEVFGEKDVVDVSKEFIGNGCDLVELVNPQRMHEIKGIKQLRSPMMTKKLSVGMLIDSEGLLKDNTINPIGSFLYKTDEHGHPIVGNIVFCGLKYDFEKGILFTCLDDTSYEAIRNWLRIVIEN